MARNHNGNRVCAIGKTYGPHCCRTPDVLRQRAIRGRSPARDFTQRAPDLALERRSACFDGDTVYGIQFAGEIASNCFAEPVWIVSSLECESALAALKAQVAPDNLLIFGKKRSAQFPFQIRD